LAAIAAGDGYDRFYVFDETIPDIAVMVIAILIALAVLIFYFPTVVHVYVIDTSIQMMKRRDYIEIVIKEQKHQKAMRSMRMYQVFKLIRRELIEHYREDVDDKALPRQQVKLLQENYEMMDEAYDNEEDLRADQLNDFYYLSGQNLKKLESYLLEKKAQFDGDHVKFEEVLNAIRQTANDVKVDPYEVISTIFMLILKDKYSYKLSFEEIELFFSEYDNYFEKQDVEDFKEEILALQRDGGMIDIQEIASLIRDDIECYPR
jgi:hypothetical protein